MKRILHYIFMRLLKNGIFYKTNLTIYQSNNIWRLFPGEWCPDCECPVMIYTRQDIVDGYGFDDDKITCPNCNKKAVFKPLLFNKVDWTNNNWKHKELKR